MKKLILAIVLILVIVFVIFSMLDRLSEYNAERLLYKAMKNYGIILINPDVAPPKMLASVENNLKKVISNFPESSTTKMAYMQLVELYVNSKKYDEALFFLNEIIEKYESDVALLTRARFAKAGVYERNDQWDKALGELAILKNKYLNTPIGLQVPFYIANYYKKKGNAKESEKASSEAISFYINIKEKNKGTALGYASSSILLQTYLNFDRHEQAGELVEEIIVDYPIAPIIMQQLPYADLIFIRILKKPERAIKIYNLAIERTSNEKIKKALEERIKELQNQK